MTTDIALDFTGPFAWLSKSDLPCVFEVPMSRQSGIYLWTVGTTDGDLVYYVGETGREFGIRLTEHLKDQLAGMYHIYDPAAFVHGVKEPLWGGMFGKSHEGSLSEFVVRLPKLATALVGFVRVIRFYLAPFAGDARIRKRIEAALADHFYAQGGIVGQFQDEGIHYERTRQGEAPLVVNCHWSGHIRGAPETLVLSYESTIGAA
ncbi:MAG: GIY-YIG nuclease family protein [Candidatus Rokubacteria bacterium]|nr:GIY-YIG nuclease family protein [Candidatus Rokubacteria bacterium]